MPTTFQTPLALSGKHSTLSMTSAFCFLLGKTHGVPSVIQVHQVRLLKNTLIHSVTCFCGSTHWKYNLTHTAKTVCCHSLGSTSFTSKHSSRMNVVLSPSFHWTSLGEAGTDGTNGVPGVNGTDGVPGANGTDGVPGVNGTDGVPGVNGMDGVPGVNGTDGVPGVNGMDGVPGSKGR